MRVVALQTERLRRLCVRFDCGQVFLFMALETKLARRLDQQTGLAEPLAIVAGEIGPAEMIEPAPPVRAAAVALGRGVMKQG